MGAINVLGTLVAGALVDRAGRKQLLIVSFLGQAAAMLCMSAGLALPQLAVRPVAPSHALACNDEYTDMAQAPKPVNLHVIEAVRLERRLPHLNGCTPAMSEAGC